MNPQDYLTATGKAAAGPNFWMSSEYIIMASLVWTEENGLFGYKLPATDEWMFPPITNDGEFIHHAKIFAGFPVHFSSVNNSKFLDRQYIYNPKAFQVMEGKAWSTFRKNVRKFPARTKDTHLEYRPLRLQDADKVGDLTLEWAERMLDSNTTIYDNDVFPKYMIQGENRWGLFNHFTLLGVNVWDENDVYVNYRYCVNVDIPFLNEYMRLLFYINIPLLSQRNLVNDGGDLGEEGLRRFKMKLNPQHVLNIYSYSKE